MNESLGPMLKTARQNAGLSREEAAVKSRVVYRRIVGTEDGSGIDAVSMGHWEREDRCPSVVQVQCLMEAIGLPAADQDRAVPGMLADLEARIRGSRATPQPEVGA